MTGTIILIDDGQNYIEFDIACFIIEEVRPARFHGWRGTRVLNTKFEVGGYLKIDLQWKDYDFNLKYKIAQIVRKGITGDEWLQSHMSSERKMYACPRGGADRMLYNVNCKGLPFYFNCVNLAAVAAADALSDHEKIPTVLLDDVDACMLFNDIKPGSPETIADFGHDAMVIYNNFIVDYGIITHEATHAWAYDKWGQFAPPFDTDYTEVIRFSGEEPITEYAKTNYSEDLAEGVRYYVYDPPWMKSKCPLRYAIIEHMMSDPSYYG